MTVAVPTARSAGLVACRRCARVWPLDQAICGRCGSRLQSRDGKSLQKVWAWWVAGLICYVPANFYPMLETRYMFTHYGSTIVGGALEIGRHGAWGVAAIILTASLLIPIGKFVAIAWLATSVRRGSSAPRSRRFAVYEVVEYVGRWSMIDVFVVALSVSLVQLSVFASITPGPASMTFALSVIFTMLSAQSFDSRLIWDGPLSDGMPEPESSAPPAAGSGADGAADGARP